MEDKMKDISDFISSVGFPIVVCLLMIYQQQKMSDSYIEIVESLKELINDNTTAINLFIKSNKEDTNKMMDLYAKQVNGVTTNENKQETSPTVPTDQQTK